MFANDYIVYADEDDKDSKWLFLNKEGAVFTDKCRIDLENFVRTDEENPKKGEVLWNTTFEGRPQFKREYESDSSEDSFSDDDDFFSIFNRGRGHSDDEYAMKWKMEAKAKIKPKKNEGETMKLKIKAKGTATRKIRTHRDDEGNVVTHNEDHEKVKKISYKLEGPHIGPVASDDEEEEPSDFKEKFKIKGDLYSGRELKWNCSLFKAKERYGVNTVQTKEGYDPALGLIVAHLCATEFDPNEIKKDFSPMWESQSWYRGHRSRRSSRSSSRRSSRSSS